MKKSAMPMPRLHYNCVLISTDNTFQPVFASNHSSVLEDFVKAKFNSRHALDDSS